MPLDRPVQDTGDRPSGRRITGCNTPFGSSSPSHWQASSLSQTPTTPDRIYPIVQLTDRDVAEIDVTDGSVEDWENIVGEPTLTPLDFAETYGGSYDPSDMDFRIWLGWHDATDRIFFAMERSTTYTSTNTTGRMRICSL